MSDRRKTALVAINRPGSICVGRYTSASERIDAELRANIADVTADNIRWTREPSTGPIASGRVLGNINAGRFDHVPLGRSGSRPNGLPSAALHLPFGAGRPNPVVRHLQAYFVLLCNLGGRCTGT